MKTAIITFMIFTFPVNVFAGYDYQLYKNHENYGIVVFPKNSIFKELEDTISSLAFSKVDFGKAVMRRGSKNENETLMMPLEVQKKHSMEKFIVIQVLGKNEMLAGIYDPEWGLTLPSSRHTLEAIKQNILRTLNVFRGNNPQKRTQLFLKKNVALTQYSRNTKAFCIEISMYTYSGAII
jgi:hypothetical protein